MCECHCGKRKYIPNSVETVRYVDEGIEYVAHLHWGEKKFDLRDAILNPIVQWGKL